MFQLRINSASANAVAQASAISKSQGVIEFDMDGKIITANQNFLDALGYRLEEIQGKHHSMFVTPAMRESAEYRAFWASLNRGEHQAAEYKRIGKGGREVWILVSYNPLLDDSGKPFKVVKFASDVSEQKLKAADFGGQVEAIGKSQAVIEFSMDGIVLDANENFLKTLGYSFAEIKGKHDITGQINLRALNATIKSARAGEAGRGFAVVAAEVKNLANQAKQATDKIGQEIGNLNDISSDVVGALNSIKNAIQSVSEYVSSTAAAIEEQSTVTGEMSSSMSRAAAEAAGIGQAA
jgi:methyl-accepting chemotaxis protein